MSKKNTVFIVIALISCVVAAVFMLSESNSIIDRNNTAQKYNIEVIFKAKSGTPDFWRIVEQGVNVASTEFSVDYRVSAPENENNIEQQFELMGQAIKRSPDAIILAAGDMNLLSPLCELATANGIVVIMVDSDVVTDKKEAFVGTNNIELGEKLAELVDSNINEDESFGVIGHVAGTSTAIERFDGLVNTVKNAKDRMVGIEYCDGSPEKAKNQALKMIKENPTIKCMVGLNESSSLGISVAVSDLGLSGKVKIVTCDSSTQQIQYMENGVIQAVVVQNPFNMGYISIKTAVMSLRGKKVEPVINTGCIVITKDDMQTQENQKLLFPFVE